MTSTTTHIRRTDMTSDKEELLALRKRFESHLDDHRVDLQEYAERQLKQDLAHEEAMKAITELTIATKGLVDAWTTVSQIQKFFKWLSGFAFLGIVISWAVGFNPFK